LKVLARLATDEHRVPQDGKIRHKSRWGEALDLRLSVIPTTHDEKAVMRLLSEKNRRLSLANLGFFSEDLKSVSDAIKKPWGMILVTGPTGSGKTTTLYAMLQILNRRDVNITTIEDPVEYEIESINQIPVNEKTGLTFAKGLRSIVRQDPDIIMVGEIRDKDTANIAVNAAMTGHLVLSTLHTNDAATAFPRLSDMGIENFLIASTVNIVIAQRLVRKICMNCIQSVEGDEIQQQIIDEYPEMKEFVMKFTKKKTTKGVRTFKGKGCHVCHQSGYFGRIGIFEVMAVSETIKEAIMKNANADQIRESAVKEGMPTMLQDGVRRVLAGQTTLEEVLRVTRE
jgi:type IV pilus assembly protein PilB